MAVLGMLLMVLAAAQACAAVLIAVGALLARSLR
jgi:hypothetical protein